MAGVVAGLVAVVTGAALVVVGLSGQETAEPSPPDGGGEDRQDLVAAVGAAGAAFEERMHPPRWDAAGRVLVVPVAGLSAGEEADLEATLEADAEADLEATANGRWEVDVVAALFAPAELEAAAVAASRALTALGLGGTQRWVRADPDAGAVVLVVPDASGDPGIGESNQRAEQVVRRAVEGWWVDADARQRRGVRDLADPDALGPVVAGDDLDVDSLVVVADL